MANFHTGTTVSPESQPATTESPIRPRDIILLICWLLACGGLVFWRSFHVSYSFDDVAHLHALAAYRSGEISLTQFLLHNHNEHFLPLVRLYFMAATKISGLSSASMHLFLFLNYVAGAFACAWIAFSLTRSRLASFLAGTIFVGAAGFIGSMLWQPSDGEFSVAGTPLIFAIAILVSPYARKRWTDVAVLGLVFVAALGLGSITVPALAIPIYVFLAKPDTMSPGRRKAFIVVSVLLIAAILIITKWLMMTHQTRVLQFAFKGIIDGLLLIFFSAGRFLVAWTPFVEFDLPVDIAFSAVGWALILATLRWVPKPLRQLLAALWAGSGLLALLIGMGRWKIATYFDLFATDRYHYVFLLPLALQTAAVLTHLTHRMSQAASPERKRTIHVALGCVVLAALIMSHIRFGRQVMWFFTDQYRLEFREGKVLAKIIRKKAETQHLHLAEGPIRFPALNIRIGLGLSCIVFTQFPKGLPNVEWTLNKVPTTSVGSPWDVPPISEADAAVENQILDEWSQKLGRRPYSCMINGKMQDVLPVESCAEAAKMSPPPLAPPRPYY